MHGSLRRVEVDGEEWLFLADVCQTLGIGRAAANEPLLRMMIEPDNLRHVILDGVPTYMVTDAGAFDIASIVPRHRPRRSGRRKGFPKEPAPMYVQIYIHMRSQISNGVYLDGKVLPSTESIAKVWGVGKSTVEQARKMLRDAGYIRYERTPGKGFVHRCVVTSKHKARSAEANGIIQQGRRALRAELEAFHA
jgi:DNA-binding transcriptional regulator YhcF (GntR family)